MGLKMEFIHGQALLIAWCLPSLQMSSPIELALLLLALSNERVSDPRIAAGALRNGPPPAHA